MKKFIGTALLGLALGVSSTVLAQEGQNPPPPKDGKNKIGKRGERGGKNFRGGQRGGGFGRQGMMPRGGMRGGMPGGGFGISDSEIYKLNLTDAQKVQLFNFRKKMADERTSARQNFKPGERTRPANNINREEMRQLMSAKQLGTLTAEQKSKLDALEATRKAEGEKRMAERKTQMDQRRAKMDQTQKEFLNIFTLDQRKQLEQMRADRAKEMQERMKQRQEQRPDRRRGAPQGQKPAA